MQYGVMSSRKSLEKIESGLFVSFYGLLVRLLSVVRLGTFWRMLLSRRARAGLRSGVLNAKLLLATANMFLAVL